MCNSQNICVNYTFVYGKIVKQSYYSLCFQYEEGIHPYMEGGGAAAGAMYDHRPLQSLQPHLNHGLHYPPPGNHVSPASNHVMGAVPDVHKRDKDSIYG